MQREYFYVGLDELLADGAGPPSVVVPRKGGLTWFTPESPVDHSPLSWIPTREGEYVRVPVYRYYTAGVDPAVAMLAAFDLGALAAAASPVTPKRLVMIMGTPVRDLSSLGRDALEFWLGLAVSG